METLKRRVARMPFAPVVAPVFGAVAAILVAAVPVSLFESGVMRTGLPQMLSIAQPPLGLKARILAIFIAFVVIAGLSWLVLRPVERWLDRDRRRRRPWADTGYGAEAVLGDVPVASVDVARKPIFAPAELGAPLMSDEALASVPLPPLAPVPELAMPIDDADLAPVAERSVEAWVPSTPPEGETSIHALIRRLEAGLAKRGGGRDPEPGGGAAAPAPFTLPDAWIMRDDADESGDTLRGALGQLKRFAWR